MSTWIDTGCKVCRRVPLNNRYLQSDNDDKGKFLDGEDTMTYLRVPGKSESNVDQAVDKRLTEMGGTYILQELSTRNPLRNETQGGPRLWWQNSHA